MRPNKIRSVGIPSCAIDVITAHNVSFLDYRIIQSNTKAELRKVYVHMYICTLYSVYIGGFLGQKGTLEVRILKRKGKCSASLMYAYKKVKKWLHFEKLSML